MPESFLFAWPMSFAVLPLAWLVYLLLPALQSSLGQSVRLPFFNDIQTQSGLSKPQAMRSLPISLLMIFIWLCLILAAARPQWLGDAVELPLEGRDLMLALDVSGSMEVADFKIKGQQINRLQVVKTVASQFIRKRLGDRIGLILFGSQAYLQTPLTFDRETVAKMLDEAEIGLAGKQTAIGDAIGLAIKRLKDNPDQRPLLILLTDGANTAGQVEPLQAAKLAATENLKIYTIGLGADSMVRRSFFGSQRVNPSKDLDEKTLSEIAKLTGGKYFRARDTQALEEIYHLLDDLEPRAGDAEVFRPIIDLYYWPLAVAWCLSLLLISLKLWLKPSNNTVNP